MLASTTLGRWEGFEPRGDVEAFEALMHTEPVAIFSKMETVMKDTVPPEMKTPPPCQVGNGTVKEGSHIGTMG